MHIRSDGYIGVAPLPGGIVNVCVVRRPKGGEYVRLNDMIKTVIDEDPVLKDRFAQAQQVTAVTSLGPLAIESRAAGCPGLVLAGDAAGFIDPMTGDGLRFALRGGELAAHAALAELTTGTPAFATLGDARVAEFSGKWRLNRALRLVVGSPRLLESLETLGAQWSAPFRYLVTLAGDVGLARRHEVMDLLPIRHSVNS
jgi:flavin-dependent dehydrogenase